LRGVSNDGWLSFSNCAPFAVACHPILSLSGTKRILASRFRKSPGLAGKIAFLVSSVSVFFLLAHPGDAPAQTAAIPTNTKLSATTDKIFALNDESYQDDQRGDYQAAAAAAQKCLIIIQSNLDPDVGAGCAEYYGCALERSSGSA